MRLFVESRRDEDQHVGQYGLPVAPRVSAVAHAVLQGDVPLAHERVEVDVGFPEKIVVAAVHPPADRAYAVELVVGHFAQHHDGRVVGDGLLERIVVVARAGQGVQQAAHRAGRAEDLGVAQGVDRRAAAAHRETRNGAVGFVSGDAVVLFDGGDELLEEEPFVVPARDIEIAHVPTGVVLAFARGVGHDDDHRPGHARSDGFVGDAAHVAFQGPVGVATAGAVQQVEHRVGLLGTVVTVGQVDRAVLFDAEYLARDGVDFGTALGPGCQDRGERKQGGGQQFFHGLFYIEYQPFQVFSFGMVYIYRVVGRLG